MKAFYLLKPDMLIDNNSINYYLNRTKSMEFIKYSEFYYIDNFVDLAKDLYDKNDDFDIIEYRKKMLITMLGYYHYYKNKGCIINYIDVNPYYLKELERFKKEFRKLYVYNGPEFYINIDNSNINYNNPINTYDFDLINCSFIENQKNIISNYYKMIFFNKLHFPDPYIESIERDLKILEKRKQIKINL